MEVFDRKESKWITVPTDQVQFNIDTDLNRLVVFRITNINDVVILNKLISDVKDISMFVNGTSPFFDQYNPISGHHYATGSGTFPNKI